MNKSKWTDENIVEVVERYSDMIQRIALHNLKNQSDAQDISQEVFLSLMKKNPEFESSEHEKAWIIRVTIKEDVIKIAESVK